MKPHPPIELPVNRRSDVIGKLMSNVVVDRETGCWNWQGGTSGTWLRLWSDEGFSLLNPARILYHIIKDEPRQDTRQLGDTGVGLTGEAED